jgi:hypothetical protein
MKILTNTKFVLCVLLLATMVVLAPQCNTISLHTDDTAVSHVLWDSLLRKHVCLDGMVDYAGFMQDSQHLNRYLQLLGSSHPSADTWPRSEQMAYWINAYNAFTVKLIMDHYPVESIKDIRRGLPFINSVWDISFIDIAGRKYDLNQLEHNILRPLFEDARIHAAINCASVSCPKLRAEAYTADRLEAQLDAAMRAFLLDEVRNRPAASAAYLSPIFSWFSGDFERSHGSVRAYVNHYLPEPIPASTTIRYLPYNWQLNAAPAGCAGAEHQGIR